MIVSKDFTLAEFVPALVYVQYLDRSIWSVDPGIFVIAQFIRDQFWLPLTINNYLAGGNCQYSAFRDSSCQIGDILYLCIYMTKRENILKLVKNRIKEVDPDSRILLFGSRARGESRKDSDWDFLILSNRKVDRDFKNQIFDTLFEVELETDEVLTGVVQNAIIWDDLMLTPLYQNILQDGIEI